MQVAHKNTEARRDKLAASVHFVRKIRTVSFGEQGCN